MASHLASIYGTEQDKVNCSFYYKIGACRHGERCYRKHVKPNFSQTILCPNMYKNPIHEPNGKKFTQRELAEQFDAFYEDMFCEFSKYGEVEQLVVCDNVGDHLVGNVYVRFKYEESAQNAIDDLNSRWYSQRPVYAELSPVTDFREACCRQHETSECQRGGLCNFMHAKKPSPQLLRDLVLAQRKYLALNAAEEMKKEPNSDSTNRWVSVTAERKN
uniref:Splicing factor U2AF 23 kDa subunit n=1 Tax=Schizosaccharomyces pombe (strain 972 / ATCC 24843) TaxID=284812 RepID=UPI00168D9C16|nr:Chain A, Splicing factor U2AF 23 kDa subunit [Schizosaccharomyces pombe 972h-]7C08_D Chain D, Splicing factor U2AF 23 kDa subunit [Schizosaccharomyces pombe 972h-]7C08_G Chain G, Splicing factor U2AF 23 kDa subunit [Schizosaccharomyces pombe 972h-]7C08_J Chain J, Splicing factor U2AF 23 kDa subunit [Schizosaccharomyces pombe 972h-]7C08_M Chain M, Splicing factor U2AF 23 kDa subunit [Schizosaccharomyces pombe 972h-]7C08_P Chain P, Splicing factor U2AF 23 kDa subunit [Schizosaccharomyces pomb